MERSSNSEADMVTNSEKANILRAKEALREIISGKCQLFDLLPRDKTKGNIFRPLLFRAA